MPKRYGVGKIAKYAAIAILTAEQQRFAIWFVGGSAAAMVAFALAGHGIVRLARRLPRPNSALLRLALAAGCTEQAVQVLFDLVFLHGRDPMNPEVLARAGAQIGIADVTAAVQDPGVKTQLREATERAIGRGIFGVPTIGLPGGELFWGLDSTDMALACLANPELFAQAPYPRLASLPQAASRIQRPN